MIFEKIKKHWLQIGIAFILICFFTSKYRFLVMTGLNEFKIFYPNYGIYIFIIKTILISLSIGFVIYYFYIFFSHRKYLKFIPRLNSIFHTLRLQIKFKKYFVFFTVFVTSVILHEFYPFSLYPMYNNFPNWGYTFYFVDENEQPLSDYLKDNHGNISHIYFAEFSSKNWKVGEGHESAKQLNIVGKNMIEKSIEFDKAKRSGIHEIRLKRINNHIVRDELKIDTTLIYTYYLNEN